MTAKDHHKLLDAGFTIIREESRHISGFNYDMRIKAKTSERREWFTLEKDFPSRAAMDRSINNLLADKKTIQD